MIDIADYQTIMTGDISILRSKIADFLKDGYKLLPKEYYPHIHNINYRFTQIMYLPKSEPMEAIE